MIRYKEALKDFSEVRDLFPDEVCAIVGRGWTLSEMKRYADAIAEYDKALALASDKAGVYNARCWTRALSNRDLNMALSDCNQSLALRPGDPNTLDSRAMVWFRRRSDTAALADLSVALAADPKSASSLYLRGMIKLRNGDKDGGLADVHAAEAIDPKIAERYAGYEIKP
jgi:tetratricopeptide (TPR) repeat protein